MRQKLLIISIFILVAFVSLYLYSAQSNPPISKTDDQGNSGGPKIESHPLAIDYMKDQEYTGSDLVIEQTLPRGSNYSRYIVSYKSDGLKIYALLTIPLGDKPASGWPVIIFNHGYIPPAQYRTTERYIAYTDAFSRNGYILLRPDYRGHGNSEGNPEGAYYSPAYTIDVLNAVASVKKHPEADPTRLGMWGHSMGGSITLRSMVTTSDIKVGVIWAGVVASYEDMANNWRRRMPWRPSTEEAAIRRPSRQQLLDKYGDFSVNPQFWRSISPIFHVDQISGPVQIHHGTADDDVPLLFSERLRDALTSAQKPVEFFSYPGDDHNLSNNLTTALTRSVAFFDKYLK